MQKLFLEVVNALFNLRPTGDELFLGGMHQHVKAALDGVGKPCNLYSFTGHGRAETEMEGVFMDYTITSFSIPGDQEFLKLFIREDGVGVVTHFCKIRGKRETKVAQVVIPVFGRKTSEEIAALVAQRNDYYRTQAIERNKTRAKKVPKPASIPGVPLLGIKAVPVAAKPKRRGTDDRLLLG